MSLLPATQERKCAGLGYQAPTPHCLPIRGSSGVSFVNFCKIIDRKISSAQYLTTLPPPFFFYLFSMFLSSNDAAGFRDELKSKSQKRSCIYDVI